MTDFPKNNDPEVTRQLLSLVHRMDIYAFILMTPSGEVSWVNRAAQRMFGLSFDEFVGRPGQDIFTDRDQAAGLDQLEMEIAASGMTAEDDRWHVRADGGKFWTSGGLAALHDAEGRLIGFGKIIRDRTDFKTQLDLLSNQMKAAQEDNANKDAAITKLSHELRNVISGLRGAVSLLDQPLDSEQRRSRFGQLMQNQLAMVDRLTHDLLDVKRSSSGKVTLELESIVLQAQLRELLESHESRIRQSKLVVEMFAPAADIIVDGDRVRLRQVFGNLLDNAIKYTPADGRIYVKLVTEGDEAVIQFQDTGSGIPSDMLSRIFDLFTQVDAAASSGGLGVGLALVRELVTLHGGSVQAASQGRGKGSEFTVRLPLKEIVI